jgi:hypothetical protein
MMPIVVGSREGWELCIVTYGVMVGILLGEGAPSPSNIYGALGDAVVEALRYKSEGRGFDSRWYYWIFY